MKDITEYMMRDITAYTQELSNSPILQLIYAFAKRKNVELYLVGGSVRDLYLERPISDFDFTMGSDAIQFAKSLAGKIQAPCIPLEENPPTARVIIKPSQHIPTEMCLDFAQFRAATLEKDLRLRDLTVNAMAIPLESLMESNRFEVIDPCNGRQDLVKGKLHFPSKRVINDDPLRLMRIYRFATQLGFDVPYKSAILVYENRKLIKTVSKERVRDELFKLLNRRMSEHWLHRMYEIGLLSQVVPYLNRTKKHWYALSHFEGSSTPIPLSAYKAEIETYLNKELGLNASRRSLLKICLIIKGNPEKVGERLCLSKKAVQFMKSIFNEYPQLTEERLTKKQRIDFLRETGTDWWGVLLYNVLLDDLSELVLTQIAAAYYRRIVPILKQGRLITGGDIIRKFQVKEGEVIGKLLKQVEDRQYYGEIRTREEALAVVESILNNGDKSI